MLPAETEKSQNLVCMFIGSALCFSDTAFRLAAEEISCITFRRLPALADLVAMTETEAAQVRLVIVAESMLTDLQEALPAVQQRFPQSRLALAYRNRDLALRLIAEERQFPGSENIGFLPMGVEMDHWLSALRLLIWGERYVPADLISASRGVPSNPASPAGPEPEQTVHLTERECQVLSAAAEGKQNKIIADDLGLSQHTVKLHMHHFIAKLGVSNRTEATIWYLSHADRARGRKP
ncbi:helix-turn-helix transcriptional regulator [Roseovarius sp. S1116L3]|uniref:helix-turn-helix transcriptional regulator n=1 Tax=Roseovarius roseus TaxID=3342636 RepID=UPI0037283954